MKRMMKKSLSGKAVVQWLALLTAICMIPLAAGAETVSPEEIQGRYSALCDFNYQGQRNRPECDALYSGTPYTGICPVH